MSLLRALQFCSIFSFKGWCLFIQKGRSEINNADARTRRRLVSFEESLVDVSTLPRQTNCSIHLFSSPQVVGLVRWGPVSA